MRILRVEGLRVQASVGILQRELLAKQPLLISVSVELPDAPVLPTDDDIRHVLDYRHLRRIAKTEAESGHVHMLESLAGRIAHRARALPGVAKAHVRIVKTDIYPDCDGMVVEVCLSGEPGC